MALLQRVLDTISPASPHYLDVHTALMRLQRADTTANLEAPDLTAHISDISDEPFAKGGGTPCWGDLARTDVSQVSVMSTPGNGCARVVLP